MAHFLFELAYRTGVAVLGIAAFIGTGFFFHWLWKNIIPDLFNNTANWER